MVNERLNKAKKRLNFILSLELDQDLEEEIVGHLQREIADLEEIVRMSIYEKIYS